MLRAIVEYVCVSTRDDDAGSGTALDAALGDIGDSGDDLARAPHAVADGDVDAVGDAPAPAFAVNDGPSYARPSVVKRERE